MEKNHIVSITQKSILHNDAYSKEGIAMYQYEAINIEIVAM